MLPAIHYSLLFSRLAPAHSRYNPKDFPGPYPPYTLRVGDDSGATRKINSTLLSFSTPGYYCMSSARRHSVTPGNLLVVRLQPPIVSGVDDTQTAGQFTLIA